MSKKMMLLALSAVCAAMFALPAVASANSWHISSTAGTFTIHGSNPIPWNTVSGTTMTCTTVTGSGSHTTTTTGKMNLTFHGCTTELFGSKVNCTSSGQPAGTIVTTELEFHNVMIGANDPGILVTTTNGHFASFVCGIGTQEIKGTGVIGRITSPKCGVASTTATVDFNATAHGKQEITTHTGVVYGVTKNGEQNALDAILKITFPGSRTGTCT